MTTRKKKSAPRAKARATDASRADSLAAVFQALGARDPKRWARAHAKGGSDALARFVLLRALWLKVVEPGRGLARARRDPHAGAAVERMLTKVSLSDLDALVRLVEELALRDVLSVLDDPSDDEQAISWGVFRRDKKGHAAARLAGLFDDLDDAKP